MRVRNACQVARAMAMAAPPGIVRTHALVALHAAARGFHHAVADAAQKHGRGLHKQFGVVALDPLLLGRRLPCRRQQADRQLGDNSQRVALQEPLRRVVQVFMRHEHYPAPIAQTEQRAGGQSARASAHGNLRLGARRRPPPRWAHLLFTSTSAPFRPALLCSLAAPSAACTTTLYLYSCIFLRSSTVDSQFRYTDRCVPDPLPLPLG